MDSQFSTWCVLNTVVLFSVMISTGQCGPSGPRYSEMDYISFDRWSNGDLRLTGTGSTPTSGRLEIYIDSADTGSGEVEGEWGTVCGKRFGMKEAHVACRQLGYYSATGWNYSTNVGFGSGNGSILLSGVRCSNKYQQHLLRCKHNGIGSGTYIHKHTHDVAIFCNSNPIWNKPYKGQVRLASYNSSQSSGRVEVYQKSQWGTVCASVFNKAAANSVCRQLGYTSSISSGVSSEPGSGVIWVGDITCNKSQQCFTSCFQAHKHTYKCNHTEDAAVQCGFDFAKKYKSAGNSKACKITGFPVSQLIFYVSISLASLLLVVTTVVLAAALVYHLRRRLSRQYEELY